MSARYAEYLKHRNNMQHPARFCLCWMQQRPRVWLREGDTVEVGTDFNVAVPGLGTLKFEMRWDEDHDSWDTDHIEKEWRDRDTCDPVRTGKSLGDDWYALAHWDRGYKFLAVKFRNGGDYKSRRAYYSAQGMSREDADVHARQAIQAECRYWYKIAEGEISWVGWIVTLFDEDDTCVADDSCWGYENVDTDYIHECMDDAARALVLAQYELKHKLTGVSNAHIAEAKLAWDTAMVTSDYDRDLADPLFISVIREKVCQKSLCL